MWLKPVTAQRLPATIVPRRRKKDFAREIAPYKSNACARAV
jgi:hypothetical protein